MKKRKGIIVTILIIVIVILGIPVLSEGCTGNVRDWYVHHTNDRTRIFGNKTGYRLRPGEVHTFKLRQILGFGASPKFDVKIVPSSTANFSYTTGGQTFNFADIPAQSLSDIFNLQKTDKSISITADKDIWDILSIIHNDQDIDLPELHHDNDYFALIFTSGGKSITINFNVVIVRIKIDREGIIF